MTITTQAQLQAALEGKQQVIIDKATQTVVAAAWFDGATSGGAPAAIVLAGTDTAAGVVPTDATTGFPTINNFGGGNTGYLAGVSFSVFWSEFRLRVCDMLFKAGAYAFNASTTLASQPSYSSRVPGADYKGTEIWFECVTAFTGNPTITVTYTNQDGTTGRSTGAIALGLAPTIGRMIQLPLQSGDTGVQKIESVIATVATVGTFNILVVRPLLMTWFQSMAPVGAPALFGPDKTDLPIIFDSSALFCMVNLSTTTTSGYNVTLDVIQG